MVRGGLSAEVVVTDVSRDVIVLGTPEARAQQVQSPRLERSYVLYKSKGPGVAGASVRVKGGGNKGRKMTEQITVLWEGLYFCSK